MDRFWDKVDKSGDCWEWTGGKNYAGYGVFWLEGKTVGAHRYAAGLPQSRDSGGRRVVVMHLCDNPSCVNPKHLTVSNQSDNLKDSWEKGRKFVPKRFDPQEIREYAKQGCVPLDIALFMGCDRQTVYNAINP